MNQDPRTQISYLEFRPKTIDGFPTLDGLTVAPRFVVTDGSSTTEVQALANGKSLRGLATLVIRGGEQHMRLSLLTTLNRSTADDPSFATNQLRLRKADKEITEGPVTLRVVVTDQAGSILAIDVNGLVAKTP